MPDEIAGDQFGRDGFARPQLADPSSVQRLFGTHTLRLPRGGANYAVAR
jgi:hypothetical protein